MNTERQCKVCAEVKLIVDYDGRSHYCKTCERGHYACRRNGHRQTVKRASYDRKRASYLVNQAKRRADRFGWDFDLGEHLDALTLRLGAGRCEMTGIPFNLQGGRTFDSPSLDRRDNTKGYTIDNVRWVLDMMNRAMGEFGEVRLREVMETWLAAA